MKSTNNDLVAQFYDEGTTVGDTLAKPTNTRDFYQSYGESSLQQGSTKTVMMDIHRT